jgi:hypothetical protein
MAKSIKTSKRNIVVMLLGSSKELTFRRIIKRKLVATGLEKRNVIIMEDVKKLKRNFDYGDLDEKFEWIMSNLKPKLIFVIFHKKVRNIDGVIFEIGWLCGKLRANILSEKLRFLFEKGYNLDKTPSYIQALFIKIRQAPFDESNDYRKCSDQIINMINPYLKPS